MSVTYLPEGNAWMELDGEHRVCQTFTPTEDFDLYWVDITCKAVHYGWPPRALLYKANASHHPTGDYLARDIIPIDPPRQYFFTNRWRLKMTPYTCVTTQYYALVVLGVSALPDVAFDIRYVKDTGAYGGGVMSKSADYGASWTTYPNDDLCFAVFGQPPAPVPPPEPPITNWAGLKIAQTLTATGYIITLTTNAPSHLWMRWTNLEPNPHLFLDWDRGTLTDKQKRLATCFWNNNEQEEEGDTLIHTFTKEPWPICETRWFFFFGTVQGNSSPSQTAIFKKHRLKAAPTLVIIEPWTVTYGPPPMERVILEPWTVTYGPPPMERVILEPWTT